MSHSYTTRDLVTMALCAALMAICAWITVPIGPVPVTLQTFGVALVVYFLGGKKGFLAILVYLLLGFIGIPVFSGFKGGAGVLLGATGGYIVGFLAMALVWVALEHVCSAHRVTRILGMILGLAACYALGTLWFYFSYGQGQGMTLLRVLEVCVFPFLLPDAVKLILAELVASRVRKALPAMN